ncbi:hypothetical protein BS78_10G173100 [Paspalum vaginatum]|nr:hypothetical protein BS78_10G173100 [Paspalum vaginatum]
MVDPVWEHGQKYKGGFVCKYCREQKSGGGATRFKEHLAHRGHDVRDCPSVPPEVKSFFIQQLDNNKAKAAARAREKLLRDAAARAQRVGLDQEEVVGQGHYDDDAELHAALRASRQEYDFIHRTGPHYERGGGSGSGSRAGGSGVRGNGVRGSGVGGSGLPPPAMFTRSQSQLPERVRDYHLGLSSAPRQQRIDTGPRTVKGKSSRELLGRAWAKACHAVGIPGRKVDDPYFKASIMETQQQGVGIKIPTGREIDGKYLDENVKETEKEIEKWKKEWDECGVTLMCDSWTGPMRNSVINFLVYSGGTMYFLKSIDATDKIQDHRYLLKEIRAVVIKVGYHNVVQLVTDNGSNYKKACEILIDEFPHIAWQPCLAHTINLMLKDIGKWPEHDCCIRSAQRICSWLYNSNNLHSMMREAIGGELVKWNATRFGTNYMFLESMLKKKDQFMGWMVSREYRNSRYFGTSMGRYAFECMTNLEWWNNVEWVINDVEPLYMLLRFADSDKTPNLGEVVMEYQNMRQTYHSKFGTTDLPRFERIMQVIDERMTTVMSANYMSTACALNPYVHYTMGTSQNVMRLICKGLEKMLETDAAACALQEYESFRTKVGEFSTDIARRMAMDRKTLPAAWWATFGGDTPVLQRVARRLLSQCASSSGCERNWSTFAYIHTKLRNRLSHKQLAKLVFVNYNLRLRLERASKVEHPYDFDPVTGFMDLSLYRHASAIEDWMKQSRSNADPTFDEDSEFNDTPLPSQMFTDIGRAHGDDEDVEAWAEKTVGDTHLGKRKTKIAPEQRKGKRTRADEEEELGSEDTTPEPSGGDDGGHGDSDGDSSSSDDGGDNDGGGTDGGGGGGDSCSHKGRSILFTGEDDFTHATQDTDHGAPSSQRQT